MGKLAAEWMMAIQNAVQPTAQDINDRVIKIAWYLFNSIIDLSPQPSMQPANAPYSLGVFSNQWYPQNGGFSTAKGTSKSNNGAESKARLDQFFQNNQSFYYKNGSVTLTNNTDYGYNIEVTGWMPSQNPRWQGAKPYRMVARSLQKTANRYRAK
jgi:hypothetical protein